jgi:hypothetical protein
MPLGRSKPTRTLGLCAGDDLIGKCIPVTGIVRRGNELYEDLIENDVVQDLHLRMSRKRFSHVACATTAALNQLSHALSPKRPQGGIHRHAAGAPRLVGRECSRVALARGRLNVMRCDQQRPLMRFGMGREHES